MVCIPTGGFFTIQQILQQQMLLAIDLYTQKLGLAAGSMRRETQLIASAISMHRKENYTRVLYRCAIAQRLQAALVAQKQANVCHLSTTELATNLVACWQEATLDSNHQAVINFTIVVVPPGWIDFYLTDHGIATWLEYLISRPFNNQSAFFTKEHPNLFSLQYAHARCCSLLRLGERAGLITLYTHTSGPVWQVVEPNPIPWLDEEQLLHLAHPAERHLIAQMLGVIDSLSSLGQPTGMKLVEAMESFDRQVRIFDQVKTQKPQLAQSRLGLVAITRLILCSLLENQLGVCAPEEL